MIRIALLEDNKLQIELIQTLLRSHGYDVIPFLTIKDLLLSLENDEDFDLLLLDWHLPDGTAASIISHARATLKTQIPILVESANDAEETIVEALEMGADDYVAKPIRSQELIARINAQLRRYQIDRAHLTKVGLFLLDTRNRSLMLNGLNLELSASEFMVMQYFFEHFDELITREDLLKHIWDIDNKIESRKVDTLLSRMRKKIPMQPEYGFKLETVHGLGYRIERTDADLVLKDL